MVGGRERGRKTGCISAMRSGTGDEAFPLIVPRLLAAVVLENSVVSVRHNTTFNNLRMKRSTCSTRRVQYAAVNRTERGACWCFVIDIVFEFFFFKERTRRPFADVITFEVDVDVGP